MVKIKVKKLIESAILPSYGHPGDAGLDFYAAEDFVLNNDQYEIIEPLFPFNESDLDFRITLWPSAFIKKIS